ncbi:unnamed protein product [Anisakis simplex]|uniref:Vesicular GABA transporter (inferred by orthology to a C. elegans protein) n=1 Tax=Anisakis simplex TaxID=6269 RepID=A0A0M3JN08_ANISI|nr:unnamed protein product [Anisakis simplex]
MNKNGKNVTKSNKNKNDEIGTDGEQVEKDSIDSEGSGNNGEPITSLQAAWNVTNAIQGMFIVGLPVAVKPGAGKYSLSSNIRVQFILECDDEKNVKW